MPLMITTAGKLNPPFGKARLQVMRLLSAVLQTNSEEANTELANLGTLKVMWVSVVSVEFSPFEKAHIGAVNTSGKYFSMANRSAEVKMSLVY